MAGSGVRFDMFALHAVPWSVVRDDVRYVETLDIGTPERNGSSFVTGARRLPLPLSPG